MKHLKIYEEFQLPDGEDYEALKFTPNEINLMKTKSLYQEMEDISQTNIYINYQLIEKLQDGFYLINSKFKCSTIQDAIRISKDMMDTVKSAVTEIAKEVKTVKVKGNLVGYRNDTGIVVVLKDVKTKIIFLSNDFFGDIISDSNMDFKAMLDLFSASLRPVLGEDTQSYRIRTDTGNFLNQRFNLA